MGRLQRNKNRNGLYFYKNFEEKEIHKKMDYKSKTWINICKNHIEFIYKKTFRQH